MKSYLTILVTLLVIVASEPPASKRSLAYSHWPQKSAKQSAQPKTKTLMVQIRSDHPVPLVFKGRPGPTHTHGRYVQVPLPNSHSHSHVVHQRRPRPVKITAPVYLKPQQIKPILRQPVKIKLPNVKPQSKPIAANYDKPYRYEKPLPMSYAEIDLPTTTKANFISEHFAPIHTIPAPNLALHDNHIYQEEMHVSSPRPQIYHQEHSTNYKNTNNNNINNSNNNYNNLDNQYQVLEEITNDSTFVDPFSDSQKFFAPDPDPSLPTIKVRPATESYNRPSNGKPLPSDVQNNNYVLPVQPLVQIVGAQSAKLAGGEIYPIQLTSHQQQHHHQQEQQQQPFISEHLTAFQAAPIPNYNPTYLVTQSNNLYSQHRQQLFQPNNIQHTPNIVEAGYANADLTQEVASDGQILQAAKYSHRSPDEAANTLPQFAALIAAPALGGEHTTPDVASFHLPNVAAVEPQGGFVISNYYGNAVQDSSQLLHAYAEEEAQRQREENELATLELQKQQHLQQQQDIHLQQQQDIHLQQQQELQQQQQLQLQLQQQQQQQHQLQLQQQQQQFQQHQQLQQIHDITAQGHHQPQAQAYIQEQKPNQLDSAASAFEEHQRLVQQHLGNTPLRIFVPDEEEARLQKRSERKSLEVKGSQESDGTTK